MVLVCGMLLIYLIAVTTGETCVWMYAAMKVEHVWRREARPREREGDSALKEAGHIPTVVLTKLALSYRHNVENIHGVLEVEKLTVSNSVLNQE